MIIGIERCVCGDPECRGFHLVGIGNSCHGFSQLEALQIKQALEARLFVKGQRVRYVPRHAKGNIHHEDCKDGVIKRTNSDGEPFVIFDNLDHGKMVTGDEDYTAALTPPELLLHL